MPSARLINDRASDLARRRWPGSDSPQPPGGVIMGHMTRVREALSRAARGPAGLSGAAEGRPVHLINDRVETLI